MSRVAVAVSRACPRHSTRRAPSDWVLDQTHAMVLHMLLSATGELAKTARRSQSVIGLRRHSRGGVVATSLTLSLSRERSLCIDTVVLCAIVLCCVRRAEGWRKRVGCGGVLVSLLASEFSDSVRDGTVSLKWSLPFSHKQ